MKEQFLLKIVYILYLLIFDMKKNFEMKQIFEYYFWRGGGVDLKY